jgi:hypothetical protein
MTTRVTLRPIAAVELSGGRGRRRVMQGEGMLTPAKPLEMVVGGRREVLRPGRDRFAPEFWACRRRPELFRPADPRDVVTARNHADLLKRSRRALQRQSSRRRTTTAAAPPRRRGPYTIPKSSGPRWLLRNP